MSISRIRYKQQIVLYLFFCRLLILDTFPIKIQEARVEMRPRLFVPQRTFLILQVLKFRVKRLIVKSTIFLHTKNFTRFFECCFVLSFWRKFCVAKTEQNRINQFLTQLSSLGLRRDRPSGGELICWVRTACWRKNWDASLTYSVEFEPWRR